jgi:hypothetical protein
MLRPDAVGDQLRWSSICLVDQGNAPFEEWVTDDSRLLKDNVSGLVKACMKSFLNELPSNERPTSERR